MNFKHLQKFSVIQTNFLTCPLATNYHTQAVLNDCQLPQIIVTSKLHKTIPEICRSKSLPPSKSKPLLTIWERQKPALKNAYISHLNQNYNLIKHRSFSELNILGRYYGLAHAKSHSFQRIVRKRSYSTVTFKTRHRNRRYDQRHYSTFLEKVKTFFNIFKLLKSADPNEKKRLALPPPPKKDIMDEIPDPMEKNLSKETARKVDVKAVKQPSFEKKNTEFSKDRRSKALPKPQADKLKGEEEQMLQEELCEKKDIICKESTKSPKQTDADYKQIRASLKELEETHAARVADESESLKEKQHKEEIKGIAQRLLSSFENLQTMMKNAEKKLENETGPAQTSSQTTQPVQKKADVQSPEKLEAQRPTITYTQQPTMTATQQPTMTATQQPTIKATQQPTITAPQQPKITATQQPTMATMQQPLKTNVETQTDTETESQMKPTLRQQTKINIPQKIRLRPPLISYVDQIPVATPTKLGDRVPGQMPAETQNRPAQQNATPADTTGAKKVQQPPKVQPEYAEPVSNSEMVVQTEAEKLVALEQLQKETEAEKKKQLQSQSQKIKPSDRLQTSMVESITILPEHVLQQSEERPSEDLQTQAAEKSSDDLQTQTAERPSGDLQTQTAERPSGDFQTQTAELKTKPSDLLQTSMVESITIIPEHVLQQSEERRSEDLQTKTAERPSFYKDFEAQTAERLSKDLQAQTAERPSKDLQTQTAEKPSEDLQTQTAESKIKPSDLLQTSMVESITILPEHVKQELEAAERTSEEKPDLQQTHFSSTQQEQPKEESDYRYPAVPEPDQTIASPQEELNKLHKVYTSGTEGQESSKMQASTTEVSLHESTASTDLYQATLTEEIVNAETEATKRMLTEEDLYRNEPKKPSDTQRRQFHTQSFGSDNSYQNYVPAYRLLKIGKMILPLPKKDPLQTFEMKDPVADVEKKDPNKVKRNVVRDPTKWQKIREPTRRTRVLAKDEDAPPEDKCKYDEMPPCPPKSKCPPKKKAEPKKCDKPEMKPRASEECPPPPKEPCKIVNLCKPDPKDDLCACEEKKPLCCFNDKTKKAPMPTDECTKRCEYPPPPEKPCSGDRTSLPPPVFECAFCKKYEILPDMKPKPKPMACKLEKCGTKKAKCPPPAAAPPNCCRPLPKRPAFCPKCVKPKFPEEPKPPKPKDVHQTASCIKQSCNQKKCVKGKAPKPPPTPCIQHKKPEIREPAPTCPGVCAGRKPSDQSKSDPKSEVLTKARQKELEKLCTHKKKKKPTTKCTTESGCKTKDECQMRKDRLAKEAADAAKAAAESKGTCVESLQHTDWKAVPIKRGDRWCGASAQAQTIKPDVGKKDKKDPGGCGSRKCPDDEKEGKSGKKAAPFLPLARAQSLPILRSHISLVDGSDDNGYGKRKGTMPFGLEARLECNSGLNKH